MEMADEKTPTVYNIVLLNGPFNCGACGWYMTIVYGEHGEPVSVECPNAACVNVGVHFKVPRLPVQPIDK
jgi:hypothetical protein